MEWLVGSLLLAAALWAVIRASRMSGRHQAPGDASVTAFDSPSGTSGDSTDWNSGDSGCVADADGDGGDGGGD